MIAIRWTLLMAGMVVASLAIAQTEDTAGIYGLLNNPYLSIGLVLIGVSILLKKYTGPKKLTSNSLSDADIFAPIGKNLQQIINSLKAIDRTKERLSLDGAVEQIDRLLKNQVFEIVELRDVMIQKVGYARYATFMSDFATGERFISRAWSAAVDGYENETFDYIKKAIPFFEDAAKTL